MDKVVPSIFNKGRDRRPSNRCSCGGQLRELLLPLIQKKKISRVLPTPQGIRKYVLKQLPHFDL